jgi:Na+/melibiose symporter-like transporter
MALDEEAEDFAAAVALEPPEVAASAAPRLPLITKVLFGAGSMADGSQNIILGGLLLLYYSQVLKLPTQLVSVAIGVSLFVDAIWDLLLAQFSDNLRSPLGRRHPLMYAATIPAALAFLAIWTPPAHLAQGQLFAWLFVSVLAFRFSHSVYMVPSGALLPELGKGYHDRTMLYGYRYLLGTIGGAMAAALTYGVFLRATPQYPLGQLNPAGYPPIGLAVGVFIGVSYLISTVGTQSRIPGLYRPPAQRFQIGEALRQMGFILKNHNFIVATAAGMLSATAAALIQGLAIYFNTFMFHLPASNIVWLILTQLISAPIAFALAPVVSRRLSKRTAFIGLHAASLIFVYGPITLRLLGVLPPNGSPLLLPLLTASSIAAGILTTSGAILNTSMISDIVEENQASTGRRSEGVVLFCDRLLLKVASSFATILPGILLGVVHFPASVKPTAAPPAAIHSLALIYVPLAVSLSLFSMLTLLLFRIDRTAHDRNLQAIAAAKAAGGQP